MKSAPLARWRQFGPFSWRVTPLLVNGRPQNWVAFVVRLGPLTLSVDWRGRQVAQHWMTRHHRASETRFSAPCGEPHSDEGES
jgi:hypothetical protein